MSEALLNKILNEALAIVEKDLREELNVEVNEARFTPDILKKAILDQLQFAYASDNKRKFPVWDIISGDPKLLNNIMTKINNMSTSVMGKLKSSFQSLNLPGIKIVVSGKNTDFTVTSIVTDINSLATRQYRGKEYKIDSFASIREGYAGILKKLWEDLGAYINENVSGGMSEQDKIGFAASFADLEHALGASVAEKKISSAFTHLYNEIKKRTQKGRGTANAKKILQELGFDIYLDYLANPEVTNVKVHVGARAPNRGKFAKIPKEKLAEFENKLRESLNGKLASNYKKIATEWGGSDTRMTIERKKVVANFVKQVKKNKAIKSVKTIDTKLKLSRRKSKTKKAIKKVPVKTMAVAPLSSNNQNKIIKVTPRKKKSTINLNTLKAEINAKLSMTVIKNMGTPALENRTGRFARSVEVTDVIQTPKGFPSIGYTYQKGPYQTFEPGFAQGSTQRDPRVVISKSIREIAKELIVGRFYTRRT